MRRLAIFLLILFLLIISACSQSKQQTQAAMEQKPQPAEQPKQQTAPETSSNSKAEVPQTSITTEKIVEITSDGFNPSTMNIKAGDSVIWVNKDSAEHWPASAQHPTHNAYPEPGGCIGSKFDACTGLKQGQRWYFTFNQKGSWNYHDHLNPQPPFFGKIIVE